jgi:hypothetical protein
MKALSASLDDSHAGGVQIMPFVNQLSEEYSDVTFVKVDTTRT